MWGTGRSAHISRHMWGYNKLILQCLYKYTTVWEHQTRHWISSFSPNKSWRDWTCVLISYSSRQIKRPRTFQGWSLPRSVWSSAGMSQTGMPPQSPSTAGAGLLMIMRTRWGNWYRNYPHLKPPPLSTAQETLLEISSSALCSVGWQDHVRS